MLEEWDNEDMVCRIAIHQILVVFKGSGNNHLHAYQRLGKSEGSMSETVKICIDGRMCHHDSRFGQTGTSRDRPLMSWDLHGGAGATSAECRPEP
jgi:hypothetical protein